MLGYKKVLNMVDFDGSDKVEPPKNIFLMRNIIYDKPWDSAVPDFAHEKTLNCVSYVS